MFVIGSILVSIVQFILAKKQWLKNEEIKEIFGSWMEENTNAFYLITLLTGGTFASVELCNSNIFGLDIFDMGLTYTQVAMFRNKRYVCHAY